MSSNIRIFALGGLDENGKNLYVIEVNHDIILIESGNKYPETEQLGVQEIIPDFKYLENNKDRIRGIFITHAHDDVMGSLAALLKVVPIPVYTSPLTARLVAKHCEKEGIRNPKIVTVKRSDSFMVGNIRVKTFGLTMSIMDGFGVAIWTEYGYIVYCGEFIVDLDVKMPSFKCDLAELAGIGNEKVFALLCESNGADVSGYTSPRHKISAQIESAFEEAESRIIVSCYFQNIYRIIEILSLAAKYRKKVFFYDEKLWKVLKEISDLGYYTFPENLIVYKPTFNNEIEDIVIVVSGIGKDVFHTMMRVATGEDSVIQLKDEDTVIIASPANSETEIEGSQMKNELYKENVDIVALEGRKVLSMHASQEDLKMMIYLFKPAYYIPIKGEYRHLINSANIALDMGYRADHIVVLDNGQIANFDNGILKSTSSMLDVDEVMVDGTTNSDISSFVLKDREVLSQDGVIIVGCVLNYNTKEIIGGPDVQSRGMIYLKDADYIVKEVGNILEETIREMVSEHRFENMQARVEAKDRIIRYLLRETGKRPMILPAIVEINISE